MHYVPESTRAILEGEAGGVSAGDEPGFHFASAPIYALTLAVGLLLGADLVIGMIDAPAWNAWQSLFGYRLALVAAVLGGARILYQSLEGLLKGYVGADLALTIATLAAILLGEHSVAALVVFIALVGESLEGYTVDRAAGAVRSLFQLCPRTAHVLRGGRELDVPVRELALGEQVVVRPGERIPVDGQIQNGQSTVDQSALTGESIGIDKGAGDSVFAGTLNQLGWLTVRVDRLGEQTTFGQVVKLVASAMARKAPMERTADRLARLFLPAVLTAAALTLIGWRLSTGEWKPGWMPALGVLVVACPCPLILATPSAVMAAMAWLARSGVVIKGSIALERLASIDLIAFDKTGTLTRGEVQLASVVPGEGLDEHEVLRLAAAAERRSEHVFARLVVREAENRRAVLPEIDSFEAVPGLGVKAALRATHLGPLVPESVLGSDPHDCEATLLVGNQKHLEAAGIALDETWTERLESLDERGETPLWLGLLLPDMPGRVLGLIGVRDTLRSEAPAVLSRLQAEGVQTFALLTGDRAAPAKAVAGSLAMLQHVEAGLLPADKAAWIEARQKEGRRVAMVGDGVNDAPALATAHVGLALGSVGSDLAAEAGDLILMGDPLTPLPGLLRLSRETVKVIRQSIYIFAFGMNGLGVVLCAWGLLSPVGGAIFHEVSSLAVMLNSLRLLWFERWQTTHFGRFAAGTTEFAEWLTEALSPSRAVFGFVRNWNVLARLALAALGLWWCSSNFVVIRADEQALVTRYGRLTGVLEPGLHLRWPWPFEQVLRERVDEVRVLEIGARSSETKDVESNEFRAPIEWQTAHADQDAPLREEAFLLAGDEVALEMTAVVQFHVRDLKAFRFGVRNPEDLLRAATEETLRLIVAQRPLERLLAEDRDLVERLAVEAVQKRADEYRLGVDVSDVALLDVHPPTAVVPSYRDVANALEEHEQSINLAGAEATRLLYSVAGEEAIRALAQKGPAVPVSTGSLPLDWNLNDAQWRALVGSDPAHSPLSGEASAALENAHREKMTTIESARGSQARLLGLLPVHRAQPILTRQHLYWQAMEATLQKRPLTILDPNATGRQHLFLVDPERFNLTLPITGSETERVPPEL